MDQQSPDIRTAVEEGLGSLAAARTPAGESAWSVVADLLQLGLTPAQVFAAAAGDMKACDRSDLVRQAGRSRALALQLLNGLEVVAEPVLSATGNLVLYQRIAPRPAPPDVWLPPVIAAHVTGAVVNAATTLLANGVARVLLDIRDTAAALALAADAPAESVVVALPEADLDRSGELVSEIRAAGGLVAITRFGEAGGRVLQMCRHRPDYVEIAPRTVGELLLDPDVHSFVEGLCAMQRRQGASVVAPGVRSDELREALRALGVDGVSGPAVAPAVAVAGVLATQEAAR